MIPPLPVDLSSLSSAPSTHRPITPSWEHISHQRSIEVLGHGHSPAAAFSQTALALIAAITAPSNIRPLETVSVECRAPNLELLLTDWVTTLINEIKYHQLLFCAFDTHIQGQHLHATAWGELIDPSRHQAMIDIQGACLQQSRVDTLELDHWLAQCVIDL